MERVRLPPEIIRAVEKIISDGGTAKIKLVHGEIKVQRVSVHLVAKAKARR